LSTKTAKFRRRHRHLSDVN